MKHFFAIAAVFVAFDNVSRSQDASDSQPVIKEVIRAVGGPEKLLRSFA